MCQGFLHRLAGGAGALRNKLANRSGRRLADDAGALSGGRFGLRRGLVRRRRAGGVDE